MKRLRGIGIALLAFPIFASAAPPPIGQSAKILSPRFFPGWQSQNVCYPFVVRGPSNGYRMYYAGSASEQWNDSVAEQWVTGYVTSMDSMAWKHPIDYEQILFVRKLYEGDVIDPDRMAAVFDSMYAIGACVIQDGATWKAWYTGWNGQFEHVGGGISKKINFRIGYATSPDGLKWTKVPGEAGAGAILGLGPGGGPEAKGVAHPHVIKEGGSYRMWYEGYDGRTWRIFHATSNNGTNWARAGQALGLGGANSKDELGLRNPMVIQRKGKYELWYQGQSSAAPNYHVLRATSDDGLNWSKIAQEVVLHPTPALAVDEGILVDSAIVQPDDAVQLFFAKETRKSENGSYGTLTRRNFAIYTEVVNP